MIAVTGHLYCADESEAEVVRAHLPEHMRLTKQEPGCLKFEVEQVDPLTWSVDERFADRDSFEAHKARAGGSDWGRATAGIDRNFDVSEL
ncbi:putative quinol monooxygenase [Histidinibacterium aquaticum]|uniref:Antibiotic biosynthesis monooxygenase n=1 Tax=Histidinibacterium aquaticum TaxID=2613962 RepID=A0A5J5GG43_9RHOB|nr:antibiotic biosynthesis monooxygenase [Histidinibacterium aquaticum]KAA9006683.1 antibiotic biosynthesis monooxygenase [Histidinibacterium aquaticum]